MLNQWWYATQGGVKVPAGLILAAKDGIDLGTDWSVWTAANGRFLRGTDSDSVVGTTGSRYGLSVSTSYSGAHVGWSGSLQNHVVGYGWDGPEGSGPYFSPSNDIRSQGGHTHLISLTYRPPYGQIRLIQALNKALVPIGAIMFGDAANTYQAAYLDLDGRLIYPGTSVNVAGAYTNVGCSFTDDTHDHVAQISRKSLSTGVMPTSVSAGGNNHQHYAVSLNVGANMARCALRAFDIIDQKNIKGLIGMWSQAGVPDGWELVAAMTDRYLILSSTGTGNTAGNNLLSFSGSVNERTHTHFHTGSTYATGSGVPHVTYEAHSHTFSRSGAPYHPERYHIKFIRYVG